MDKLGFYPFSWIVVVVVTAQLSLDSEVSQLKVVLDWWDPRVVGQGDLGGRREEEQDQGHLGDLVGGEEE